MNNYKFRGKSAVNGIWIYGVGIKHLPTGVFFLQENNINENTFMEVWHSILSETVGQWTGLKDKNGKDIYEGDSLKDGDDMALVIYSEEDCAFIARNQYGDEFYLSEFKSPRVISNIHDNPELLEGK